MRAALLGSTPLAHLARCPSCGRAVHLDRRSPSAVACGGCGLLISQSLRALAESSFEATPERLSVLRALLTLERRAALLASRTTDAHARARVLNVALYLAAQREMLAGDWHAQSK